jgi:hypothetical protein
LISTSLPCRTRPFIPSYVPGFFTVICHTESNHCLLRGCAQRCQVALFGLKLLSSLQAKHSPIQSLRCKTHLTSALHTLFQSASLHLPVDSLDPMKTIFRAHQRDVSF